MNAERAATGDIGELAELRLAFLQEDGGPLDARQAEEIRERLPGYYRAHLDRDLFVFVVRGDGRIVSCAFLLLVEKPMSPAFPNGKTGTVLNVYTLPSHRRRGCARLVMEALMREAEEMGLSTIELKATEDGYALYRSVGFTDDRSKYRLMKWTAPDGDPRAQNTADNIRLEEVRSEEIPLLHSMQIESFLPLYEKYRDAGSPAIEPVEKLRARAAMPGRAYYFIVRDGERVGAINIGSRQGPDGEIEFRISPLFVLPAFQNQGIGCAAIRKAFAMHPEAPVWRLDTIKQEPGNCHLYEKCGFVRTGEEEIVNERMTLIGYERRAPGPGAAEH